MYRILYYQDHADKNPQVLHDVDSSNKILSGEMTEVLNTVTTVDLTVGFSNTLYQRIEPIVGLIRIINTLDMSQVFYGRVLKPLEEMKANGLYSQRYLCEDMLSYFNDSMQSFQKVINNGLLDFFTKIINNHNLKVEPHKRFKVGRVTMSTDTDLPHRFLGYQSTFETLKEHVVDKIGGYIQIRYESDGMYIDWLKEIGEFVDSPIEAGENILSAKRETSFEGMITRLVPLGADKNEDNQEEEIEGLTVIRERWDIKSVNGGKDYIDDIELIEKFGIIERKVDWTDIDEPNILKERGDQYMAGQRAILTTWEVDVVEKSLIDDRFKKFEVGNTHPINNPPMSGVEELQIIEKRTDFLAPQRVGLVIGADRQTLSGYYLQIQEAQKSIENVIKENEQNRREKERLLALLSAKQAELASLQSELNTLISSGAPQQEIDNKNNEIAQKQAEINALLAQIGGL